MKTPARKNRRGFSLVELLAVVLILAVLAGVAVPVYLNQRDAAAKKTCAANEAAISKAVSLYVLEHGTLPTSWTDTFPAELLGSAKSGGLAAAPVCPADSAEYYTGTVASGVLTIACHNANHSTITTTVTVPSGNVSGLD
jgi:prepilin-type N-terminal cleavage/methylation domain-containing protein